MRPTVRQAVLGAAGAIVLVVVALLAVAAQRPPAPHSVPLSSAVNDITARRVTVATLDDRTRRLTLTLNDRSTVRAAYPEGYGADLTRQLLAAGTRIQAEPAPSTSLPRSMALAALPFLFILAVLAWVMKQRMSPVAAIGNGRGRAVDVPRTRFSDVAGVPETVAELEEVVEYLHSPERFSATGARLPRGFLLVGPPGTGKTLLARAVAGEAGVPFFALSGSDFVETFVGVGAARVRRLFEKARKCDRAIIFIDEIDAVGKARTSGQQHSNEEREGTLNALLVEMDGFQESNVVVIAATNRLDTLDPALTRPGRFDRRITVAAPDRAGRTEILALHGRSRPLDPGADLVGLARRTAGLNGADLAFLMNEAALEAARRQSTAITDEHLDAALATAILGKERRSAVVTERDRQITAHHEAGHALAALLLPGADDPVSVSIIPRGPAGGVTWMAGDDRAFHTRSQVLDRLTVALAGRAAEEQLLDGDFTQGAAGDLQTATQVATAMVTEYGMSDLGLASLSPERLSVGTTLDAVNGEVNRILAQALDNARTLLGARSDLLQRTASALLAEETLTLADLRALEAATPAGQAAR